MTVVDGKFFSMRELETALTFLCDEVKALRTENAAMRELLLDLSGQIDDLHSAVNADVDVD